jgi:hypothetical protein
MSVSSADIPAASGIGDGDAAEVSLRESGSLPRQGAADPLRRFREAFGPFFTGVDPVAFQHDLRNEGPTIPSYPAGG